MRDFSNYYFELIRQFFVNCWEFIKSVFKAIGKFFGEDIVNYFKFLLLKLLTTGCKLSKFNNTCSFINVS